MLGLENLRLNSHRSFACLVKGKQPQHGSHFAMSRPEVRAWACVTKGLASRDTAVLALGVVPSLVPRSEEFRRWLRHDSSLSR